MNDKPLPGASSTLQGRRRSQEGLDARVTFIPRGNALLAAALAVITLAGGVWGVFGSIPSKAYGQGIIVRQNQHLSPVTALMGGRVSAMQVSRGDVVEEGEVVATVTPPVLVKELELARDRLETMVADLDAFAERQQTEMTARERATERELESLAAALTATRSKAEALGALLRDEEGLLREGLVRRPVFIEYRTDFHDAQSEIEDLKARIERAKADLVAYTAEARERFDERRLEVEDQKRTVGDLEARLTVTTTLQAPISGIVEAIEVGIGDVVEAQDIVLIIATGDPGYEVLTFLHPDEARRVTVGMPVHVVPITVKKAEFGTMRGRVVSVSEEPASPAEIQMLLRNAKLTETFSTLGSPYLCWVALVRDADARSGFVWWSGAGPPFAIEIGTLAAAEIIVREQAPIAWVVPAVLEALDL